MSSLTVNFNHVTTSFKMLCKFFLNRYPRIHLFRLLVLLILVELLTITLKTFLQSYWELFATAGSWIHALVEISRWKIQSSSFNQIIFGELVSGYDSKLSRNLSVVLTRVFLRNLSVVLTVSYQGTCQ
jgi:hypothetical protein